jgi:hypothetical protein
VAESVWHADGWKKAQKVNVSENSIPSLVKLMINAPNIQQCHHPSHFPSYHIYIRREMSELLLLGPLAILGTAARSALM